MKSERNENEVWLRDGEEQSCGNITADMKVR